jgi:hypothetical protein
MRGPSGPAFGGRKDKFDPRIHDEAQQSPTAVMDRRAGKLAQPA